MMPTESASSVASGAMMSTMRAPAMTRPNTSRASLSPPNR